jgi:uncharacterized protein (TIGR02246 family)
MFKPTRLVLPLMIVLASACGDNPSGVPEGPRPSRPARDIGGASASTGIEDVVAALNAGWAAKDAAAYAAPFSADAEVIAPIGTTLSGRPVILARHAFLFAGPLANTSQVLSIIRVQFLTGTIAIVDGISVQTTGSVVTRARVRWVMAKDGGTWEIVAAQSTNIP